MGGLGTLLNTAIYGRTKAKGAAEWFQCIEWQVVPEQIGAQIFIDDGQRFHLMTQIEAVFATEAARVSHDGEEVYGVVVLAVMESLAFTESDTNRGLIGHWLHTDRLIYKHH